MLEALAPFDGEDILPLEAARVHLNVAETQTQYDAAIAEARDLAIAWAEDYASRSLQQRQWLYSIDRFKSCIEVPIGPIVDVDGISYFDSAGVDTALATDVWYHGNGVITAAAGKSWPTTTAWLPGGVRITLTAGYATAAAIPPLLLGAVKLATTAYFENRTEPNLSGAMMAADRFRDLL